MDNMLDNLDTGYCMIAMMDQIREWIQSSVEDYMCHAPCTRCGTWYAELATKHMQHAAIKPYLITWYPNRSTFVFIYC